MIDHTVISVIVFFQQTVTTAASHLQMVEDGQYRQLIGASVSEVLQSEMLQDATSAELRLRCSLRDTLIALRHDLVGTPFEGALEPLVEALAHRANCQSAHARLSVLLDQIGGWSQRRPLR